MNQALADTVAALDCPHALWESSCGGRHFTASGGDGAATTDRENLHVRVDDFDGVRAFTQC
ncbi:hypothetical protein [Nocardia miyunensis]|uniref:hypothetical protein n=1 Tax=Nocardia miyunensis TaxID=282684 RepID=UPI0012F4AFDC|nr:hypothetical protein [Nocardia miyunensis]